MAGSEGRMKRGEHQWQPGVGGWFVVGGEDGAKEGDRKLSVSYPDGIAARAQPEGGTEGGLETAKMKRFCKIHI